MRNYLLLVIVILSGASFTGYCEIPSQNFNINSLTPTALESTGGGGGNGVLVINQFDSVFFDVAQGVITGSIIEFPIYLRSDDVINALDFAFKYDQTHLEYDTIINLTSYIEPLVYYNTNDSTVRLTSYSFTQPYANDTALLIVRFNILSGQFCSADLDSVSALLNGDAATYFVSDCTSGLSDAPESLQLSLYPNPATNILTFELPGTAVIEIMDINSKQVLKAIATESAGIQNINTGAIKNGMYLLKVTGSNFVSYEKFLISK